MAEIGTAQGRIGIIPGSTWRTAVAITGAQLVHGRYTLSNSRGEFRPEDVGFSNFITEIVKLQESVSITLRTRLRYGCVANQIVAQILGQDTSVETTGGQSDYAHTLKMTETNDGKFTTLAASYGTLANDILEFPSVKWHTMELSGVINDVPTLVATGIADRVVVTGATNALTNLTGASYQDDINYASLGVASSGHYFRMNAQGGAGLASGDNKKIMEYTLNVTRNLQPMWVLDGANSRYTEEPKQLDPHVGSLRLKFSRILASEIDLLTMWNTNAKQKAELFFDGSQIGTGVNRSYKIQLPSLEPAGEFPRNFDLQNNNSRMQPEFTFNMLKASAAPTGMTGVTDYLAWTAINTRAAVYT